MSKALFLPTGNICTMQIMKDFRPDLDFYYSAIGCDTVDIVSAYALSDIDGLENVQLIVDDEGLFADCPQVNILASLLYGYRQHGQPIVGNAIVAGFDPDTSETVPLTDEQIQQIIQIIPKL